MTRFLNKIRSCWRREDGGATVEFVLIFPVIFGIFMSGWESGLFMTRYALLDRSLDLVMRDLRLGNFNNPDHDLLKQEICDRSVLLRDCEENIRISLQPVDTVGWTFPNSRQGCKDRASAIEPVTTVDSGAGDEIMLVQVCLVVQSVFPGSAFGGGLAKDGQEGYYMYATSAFVNEP